MASDRYDDRELTAALERLFSLEAFGIKLGLESTRALLAEFGDPQRFFPAIHIAGTNGKGSTAAMIASVLQSAGLRTALYTSPHLRHFDERFRINGVPIARARLAAYAREMLPIIERHNCTFFEGTTAIGFRYFADERVDVAVIETGLGGRLDATNVLAPLVSIITSIGYDHTMYLGTTLEQIAAEKAGIIKPDTPAVVGPVAPELRAIFQTAAENAGAPITFVDDATHAIFRSIDERGTTASYAINGHELGDVRIDLIGRYQIDNTRTALAALEVLRTRFGLSDDVVVRGLSSIGASTGIHGRFEIVRHDPHVILDVAHNPDGARVLVDTLRAVYGETVRARFVYGAVKDKDVAEIAAILAPAATHLYAVRADNVRALDADEVAQHSAQAGIATTLAGSVAGGIRAALDDVRRAGNAGEVIVICGSFYVVADALAELENESARDGGEGRYINEPEHVYSPRYLAFEETDDVPGTEITSVPEPAIALEVEADVRTSRDWTADDQPRERLLRLGARALSDAELLAILLRTGRVGEDVVQVSRNILRRFANLSHLATRDAVELQEIAGIGPAKAVTLAAAFEIGRRLEVEPHRRRAMIVTPNDVARMYIPILRGVQKEQFHVLMLNTAGGVIRTELVSEGSLNASVVHPREVYRTAIIERAAGIIGLHNHPSGNPRPSDRDIEVTRQLIAAGRIVGIDMHDHIIIAGDRYVSMKERGLM